MPYEVIGDALADKPNLDELMPLCPSCNRAKSWSCEHCPNWQEDRQAAICRSCYWASPTDYKHLALRQVGRVELVWEEQELATFEKLQAKARALDTPLPDYVKAVLKRHLRSK